MKDTKTAPIINIISTTEHKDGSLSVEFEYGEDWLDIVKSDLKKKKVTKKEIQKHFVTVLTNALEEKDGYNLKVLKNNT